MSTNYVVIGSNSFGGSSFIDTVWIWKTINTIVGISRSPEKDALYLPYKRHIHSPPDRFKFYRFDVNKDTDELLSTVDRVRPEYIINYACQSEVAPSWDHPEQWYETNVVAMAKIVNRLKHTSYLKRFLHISTPEIYGECNGTVTENYAAHPSTPYAASRVASEELLMLMYRTYGFPVIIVRPTNVYGANQQLWKIIPRAIIYAKLGRKLQLQGDGKAVRSYIHVSDVSKAVWKVLLNAPPGEVYNISPDRGYTIREILMIIYEIMGKSIEECTVTTGERLGHDSSYVVDSTKIREAFRWAPRIDIVDGIHSVVDWVNRNWKQIKDEPLEYIHKP